MNSFSLPTTSTNVFQIRFQLLSLVAGIMLAVTGAVAIDSAEKASQPATRHRSGAQVPDSIVLPKQPVVAYYVVTLVPSLVIPEEAVDLEQGGIPSNVTLHFRVVDSPESEAQLTEELDWYARNDMPYQVFDRR